MKRVFPYSRKNMIVVLLMFCIGSLLAQAYAQYMMAPTKPTITETFNVNILIHNVTDLCAWQVRVIFDPEAMIVTNVTEGPFLRKDEVNTLFVARTKIIEGTFSEESLNTAYLAMQELESGILPDLFWLLRDDDVYSNSVLLGCTLIGDIHGVSGSGILATVTFGVIGEGSHNLQIDEALTYALGVDGTELQGYTLNLEI